jgi:hypothetical protein
MQAAPATVVVPLPYPTVAGMQATTSQAYPHGQPQVLLQHQLPPPQLHAPAVLQMPAAAPQQQQQQHHHNGYGAPTTGAGAAGLHSMPPTVNNSSFNHSTSTPASLSGQKRDSSGAPVHGGHGTSLFSYFKIRDRLRRVLNGFDALFA